VYLDDRIETFLVETFNPFLCSLTPPDFGHYIDGEISKLREPPTDLDSLSSEYWGEISAKRFQFDLKKEMINQLSNITLPEVLGFAEKYLYNKSTRRRLSIQVQAKGQEETPAASSTPIQDIRKFKQELTLFPIPKTLSNTPATPYLLPEGFCTNNNGSSPTTPTPTPTTPTSTPTPTPTAPGTDDNTKCIADWCLTNNQFYGSLIGGGVFLILVLLAVFFALRHYLSEQNKRDMRARMERDEVEGFLSLDQPDANEFSDFSDSQ